MFATSRVIPFVLTLLAAAPLRAQAPADAIGHWEGVIHAPNKVDVAIELDLTRDSRGEMIGTFGNLMQNMRGLSLARIVRDGAAVTFQIKGSAEADRVFTGRLSADGNSISGEYTQAGYTVPFDVARKGDARFEPPRANPKVSARLEGPWQATLHVRDVERTLAVTFTNQDDGTATGSLLNVEESLEIPIAVIKEQGDAVTLEVASVGGMYAGRMDANGTAIAGTFTQGAVSVPLTFRRVAK